MERGKFQLSVCEILELERRIEECHVNPNYVRHVVTKIKPGKMKNHVSQDILNLRNNNKKI